MDLTPEERARFHAEWAKQSKWGAALARQRMLATVASSCVFGAVLLPGVALLSVRLLLVGVLAGVPLGMLVRRKLMPRGQFGEG